MNNSNVRLKGPACHLDLGKWLFWLLLEVFESEDGFFLNGGKDYAVI